MRVDGQQQFFFGLFGNDEQQYREAKVTREQGNGLGIFGFPFGTSDKITIDAGSGDDKISVKKTGPDEYEVNVNGQKFTLSKEEMKNLTIKGGSGNDDILIDPSVDVEINVDGGSGNDRIENHANGAHISGGSGDDRIGNFADDVSIDGGSGSDHVTSVADRCDIRGGTGDDWLSVTGDNNVVRRSTGNFFDELFASLLEHDHVVVNGDGNDVK